MSVSQEELDELMYDTMRECYEYHMHEMDMRRDLDYCIENHDAKEAVTHVLDVLKSINAYGHDITFDELKDLV